MIDHDLGQIERQHTEAMAESAMAKAANGEKPSRDELRAWKRWEAQQTEHYGRQYVASLPQKTYVEWARRNARIVYSHGADFGIPVRGKTVDVPAIIARFHELLIERRRALLAAADEEGAASESLERQRAAKADLIEYERDLKREELIHRQQARQYHTRLAAVLRGAGERLGRRFGAEAQEILDEALDDCAGIVEELLPDTPPH